MGDRPASILVACWWGWVAVLVAAFVAGSGDDPDTIDGALFVNAAYILRAALLTVEDLAILVVRAVTGVQRIERVPRPLEASTFWEGLLTMKRSIAALALMSCVLAMAAARMHNETNDHYRVAEAGIMVSYPARWINVPMKSRSSQLP